MQKGDIDTLCNLGNSLLEIENNKSAYKYFQRAVKLDPNDFDATFRLAITCNNLKMPERALIHFNKLLHRDRNNADVLINKGYSLHLMGKYGRAILCYKQVLKQDPDEINAIYYMSKSTARQNDAKQTCELISKLLKLQFINDHDHNHDHDH